MQIDDQALKSLAGVLISKGAPVIGGIIGTAIGGPAGAVAGSMIGNLVPQLAQTFGLPADSSVDQVTTAIANDPAASDKLSMLEEQNRNALEWAKLQAQANTEEGQLGTTFFGRVFFAGWRPSFGWSVVVWLQVILLHVWQGGVLSSTFVMVWNPVWMAFGGMLTLRTIEKFGGVAQAAHSAGSVVRSWLKRK